MLYTIREAAKLTKMSESWWRQRVFYKDIQFLKIGRRILIPERTIRRIFKDAFLKSF